MDLDFCGIDFETACGLKASACAVGLVRIRKGNIVGTLYSMINPPEWMEFWDRFTDVHGLTRDLVQSSPSFEKLWPQIKEFIGSDFLVAHNAQFDRGVLAGCLEYYKIVDEVPRFECSLKAARRKWPELQNHQLDTISDYLGIELDHHEALSDAIACSKIYVGAN
jgi:DNA polymerase-3 subunit epsilon